MLNQEGLDTVSIYLRGAMRKSCKIDLISFPFSSARGVEAATYCDIMGFNSLSPAGNTGFGDLIESIWSLAQEFLGATGLKTRAQWAATCL